MNTIRRSLLKLGGTSVLGSAFLSRLDRVAAMQKAPTLRTVLKGQATGASDKLLLKPTAGEEGPPEPATYDRLPLEWNKRTVQRFKNTLAQRGIEAFLVRNPLNTIYLTGYWHTTTERPEATFMNKDDAAPWFMYPGLDRDSATSWWFGDGVEYFDFPHAAGAAPNKGIVTDGPTVDMFKFMLSGIKKHGIQGDKIGIDSELYPSELAKTKEVLPNVQFVNVADDLLRMRMVKTPEELALWRRAYTYFDRAHAFARDYILTHGTDVTDYEVGTATTLWINDILLRDINLANGALHHGVRTSVNVSARVGPVTGYPHPNQPQFNQIGRNMAMQVEGGARIGGCGGENYRMFIIADAAGKFDSHMVKLWDVTQHCCDMQVEMSKAGVTCSSIARTILEYQLAQGMEPYMYQRIAHGAGFEGHQAPFLSLGDHTVLEKNMTFSEEPGVFDPKNDCGFNWSDTIVVGQKTSYRMSCVPYSKEWCFVRI